MGGREEGREGVRKGGEGRGREGEREGERGRGKERGRGEEKEGVLINIARTEISC